MLLKLYKELSKFNNKKTSNLIKKSPKTLTDSSVRKTYRCQISIWETVFHHVGTQTQIKTSVGFHYQHIRIAQIWESDKIKSDVVKIWSKTNSHSLQVECKIVQTRLEESLTVCYKTVLPDKPADFLIGIYSKWVENMSIQIFADIFLRKLYIQLPKFVNQWYVFQ